MKKLINKFFAKMGYVPIEKQEFKDEFAEAILQKSANTDSDVRVFRVLEEIKREDNSYKEEGSFISLLFPRKYNAREVREAYMYGIEKGLINGMHLLAFEGTRVLLRENCEGNPRYKTFYTRFIELCEKYNIAISYHPVKGMRFVDQGGPRVVYDLDKAGEVIISGDHYAAPLKVSISINPG